MGHQVRFPGVLFLLGCVLCAGRGLLLCRALRRKFPGLCVFLLKSVDAAFGINQFLPSREERVTARANFYANIAFVGGTCFERGSARADNVHFTIGRMNAGFHVFNGVLSNEAGRADGTRKSRVKPTASLQNNTKPRQRVTSAGHDPFLREL